MLDLQELMHSTSDSLSELSAYSGFWIGFGFLAKYIQKTKADSKKIQKLHEELAELPYGNMDALNKKIAEIEAR